MTIHCKASIKVRAKLLTSLARKEEPFFSWRSQDVEPKVKLFMDKCNLLKLILFSKFLTTHFYKNLFLFLLVSSFTLTPYLALVLLYYTILECCCLIVMDTHEHLSILSPKLVTDEKT